MAEHFAHLTDAVDVAMAGVALSLQGDERLNKGVGGRLDEGETRGDVHVADAGGQGVDDGGQESLVAHHDGRALAATGAVLVAEPG